MKNPPAAQLFLRILLLIPTYSLTKFCKIPLGFCRVFFTDFRDFRRISLYFTKILRKISRIFENFPRQKSRGISSACLRKISKSSKLWGRVLFLTHLGQDPRILKSWIFKDVIFQKAHSARNSVLGEASIDKIWQL